MIVDGRQIQSNLRRVVCGAFNLRLYFPLSLDFLVVRQAIDFVDEDIDVCVGVQSVSLDCPSEREKMAGA